MVQIAYILLCHKDPEAIVRQANHLTSQGDVMAIHFDRRAGDRKYRTIRAALADNPRVTFAKKRIKCGWGEWSLVAASLHAIRAAERAFPAATHFYMISGDCMPIKTAEHIHQRLAAADVDYIESFDFFDSDWIKTGMKEDRLIYRHFFNERGAKRLFDTSYRLQKHLGLKRAVPDGLQVMIGSQWWCFRRKTVEAILDYCDRRRDVVRFFRTTWIPDETFFQTLVRQVVPARQIRCRTPTFLMFSDYGMPINFYNDQHDLLLAQDYLFARKISAEADELKARLEALYLEKGRQFTGTEDGHKLHAFLTGRGRYGRRFAPRFWETQGSLGAGRTLMVVLCKKWHVAKRLLAMVRDASDLPVVEYLFNETATALPHLGGIETSLDKRRRHSRAFLRMLFDHFGSQRLVICADTSEYELITDLAKDAAELRLLEICCDFSDDYLLGHARRVGLAGPMTAPQTLEALLPTVRYDVRYESARLREAGFENLFHLRQTNGRDENAKVLSDYFSLPPDKAREIAGSDYLFSD
ncbi:MAG: DUF5928 domain-containing protein [Paracoccaceae bacterium]